LESFKLKYRFIIVGLLHWAASTLAADLATTFTTEGVVPDVLKNPPTEKLEVSYGGIDVIPGNEISVNVAASRPTILKWTAQAGKFYTVFMSDPDAPSRSNPEYREWIHWLVVNVPSVTGLDQGDTIIRYNGPDPPSGTGFHRYVLSVFEQPAKIDRNLLTPDKIKVDDSNRAKFITNDFVTKQSLVGPKAANFFKATVDASVTTLDKKTFILPCNSDTPTWPATKQ